MSSNNKRKNENDCLNLKEEIIQLRSGKLVKVAISFESKYGNHENTPQRKIKDIQKKNENYQHNLALQYKSPSLDSKSLKKSKKSEEELELKYRKFARS